VVLFTLAPKPTTVTGPTSLDEKLLFERIADGNEAAYRQLVNLYVPLLGPMIYGIVKSQLVVEDIVQETLLRIWINRDQLPGIEKPRSWILRIAFLQALSHLRSQKVKNNAIDRLTRSSGGQSSETENYLALRTIKTLLSEAVQGLPPQQKKIYRLSREGGLSPSEIAGELSLSEQTVKNTLVNALKSIRAYLETRGYTFIWLFCCLGKFFLFSIVLPGS
jgi:RNA polymerase sigma factor (sigma-70 family)